MSAIHAKKVTTACKSEQVKHCSKQVRASQPLDASKTLSLSALAALNTYSPAPPPSSESMGTGALLSRASAPPDNPGKPPLLS
jgi:hypothetical protein